ncbi:MAG TPA: SDR family NAD(P)-dependent oxidoreductase, partial [Chloroflexota bacterium]|nr:SDR family NAD(P)-dependent oxidoreductase [Chloroflexota bacterium]
MSASIATAKEGVMVITGGAGFIGSNLAHALLRQGWHVLLLDSLARAGVEQNVDWLRAAHGDRVRVALVDVRDAAAVQHCLA